MTSDPKKDWERIVQGLWEEEEGIPLSFQNLKRWEEKFYPIDSNQNELLSIRKEKSLFREARNKLPIQHSNQFKKYSWVAAAILFVMIGYLSKDYFFKQESILSFANPYHITSISPDAKIFCDSQPIEPGNFQNQDLTENSVLLFSLGKNSYIELSYVTSENQMRDYGMRKIQLMGPGIYALRFSNRQKETWEMSHGRLLLLDQKGFYSWELITDNAKYSKLGTQAYFETDPIGDRVAVLSGKIMARIKDSDSKEISLAHDLEFRLPTVSSSEFHDKNQEPTKIPWKMNKLTPEKRKAWEKKIQDFLPVANKEKTHRLSLDELKKRYTKLQKIEWKSGGTIEGYVYMRSGKWMIHTVEGIREIDWEKIQSIENF